MAAARCQRHKVLLLYSDKVYTTNVGRPAKAEINAEQLRSNICESVCKGFLRSSCNSETKRAD